jgi:ABC-2 type transport system ATP-binding protein
MIAATATSVRVRDLARRYGPVEALRGVTFEITRGEIFGLLGPNGAGKTTALECILGLRRPDSGSIEIEGVDAVALPLEAKQRVGALLQAATLQDKITPRRVLGLFASFYREAAEVESLIERFGLKEKSNSAFDTLSGGQRQRLFLALAFVNNPGLLILDEPTAGLDPMSRRDLHALIAGMRDSGRTVLLSTHDLGEAQLLCDRVGIIDRGRIVALGRPDDLIAKLSATSGTGSPSLEHVFFSVTGRTWSEEPKAAE